MARATRTFRVEFIGDSRDLERAFGRLDDSSSKLAKRARQAAMAAGAAISTAAVASVRAAIDYESAFAGVRKTVDATEAEFQRLSTGIRRMSREIPVAATELAGIAESAGQLGIQTKHILRFTRVMADLGVATNLSGEQAATALARLANITRMPQRNFDRLGSTIVALGNNLATTESEIVEMGLRIAGAGKQVGLSEAQILGFAGALSSVGIEAEAGGSAISRVFITAAQHARKGGSELATMARVAGMSGDEFRRAFERDAATAIIRFIEGLARLKKEGGDVFGVLEDLGLNELRVRDALLRASGAGDLFRRSIQLGSEAWQENNALTKEAQQRYKTTASQLQILRNTVVDIGITVGSVLLPFVNDATGAVSRFLSQIIEGEGAGGRFRDVLGQVGSALFGVGQSLAPVIGGVARFALGVLQSREGMALLATAIGALTGRLVALGTAWAVGKVVAFAQAIAALGRQLMLVAGTALVQLRTGLVGSAGLGAALGSLAGPIGIAVGGLAGLALSLFGMKQRSDDAANSQQRLADAIHNVRNAVKQIRDVDLEAQQARLNYQQATNAVKLAEENLAKVRKDPNATRAQIRQAEIELARARLEAKRASRELHDTEKDMYATVRTNLPVARQQIQDAKDIVEARRRALERTRDEITALEEEIATRQRNGHSIERLEPLLERLREKKREARRQARLLRDAEADLKRTQDDLAGSARTAADGLFRLGDKLRDLRKMSRTELEVAVTLAFEGGIPQLKPLQEFGRGRGGPSGGPDLEGWVRESARERVRQMGPQLAKQIIGRGDLGSATALASRFGLAVTSGYRPGDKGWHGKNRARDYAGPPARMLAFAKVMAGTFGPRLLELIHTPLGYGVKNGRRVPLSFWGRRVNADHYDHVHVAMQRGGRVPGAGTGDRVPALLEPGEFVLNRRAVEAIGPRFLAELNERIARFQRGGLVGRARTIARAARAAGFTGSALKMAIAIALAESGGDPRAIGDGGASHGAWQIHRPSHPRWAKRNLLNLDTNAQAAFQISKGGRDWSAWTTYRTGAHRRFLAIAREAAIDSGRRGGRGRVGSGRGDRRILPGGLPREFGQQQAYMEMTLAELEARGATTEEWLDALREQRHNLKQRNARIVRRLREIDAALKRPLTRGTRRRLKQERLRLVQERTGILQDLQQNKEAIMERADPAAPIREEIERRTPGLNAQAALAALTPDVGDDIKAAEEAVRFWEDILAKAQAAGDAEMIAEAAQNLKQAADHLQSLTPTQMDFANRDLALAQLTETTEDDLAVLRRMEQIAKEQLDAALLTADPRDDIEAANTLKQIRDQIKSLQQSVDDNLRQQNELLKQQVDDANRRFEALRANQASLAAAISAVVSGEIGGRIGLGSQTPKVLAAYA